MYISIPPPSGKVYIGITRDTPQHRWRGGNGYVTNAYFKRAIDKYGWPNFAHEILYTGLSESAAVQKEIELIAFYDSTNPENGYNRSPGGDLVSSITAEKISNGLTGKKHSPESRRKMSLARKGKPLSDRQKKGLSESHKSNPKVIAHVLTLNRSKIGIPKLDEQKKRISLSQPSRRRVRNMDTGRIFDCISDAAKACNGAPQNITSACRGRKLRAYGYRWEYVEVKDESSS